MHPPSHTHFFAQKRRIFVPKDLKHVFKHFLLQKVFSPLQSFLLEEAKYLNGEIDVIKIASEKNPADIFTKSIGRIKFEKFRGNLKSEYLI